MISQTAEYALRAVVHLAYHAGTAQTARQVAAATRVPADYMVKVLQDLARSGLINAQRGLGGGFKLERRPEAISVLDVLNAVDPPRRIRECPLGLAAHRDQLCPLHRLLDKAMADAEAAFRSTSIAQVTAATSPQPPRSKPAALTISGGLIGVKSRRARRRR